MRKKVTAAFSIPIIISLVFILTSTCQAAVCIYADKAYETFNWGYESPAYTYTFIGLFLSGGPPAPPEGSSWIYTGNMMHNGAYIIGSYYQDGNNIYRALVILDSVNFKACEPDEDRDGIPDAEDLDTIKSQDIDWGVNLNDRQKACD